MLWRAVMLAIELGKNPDRPAFVRFLPKKQKHSFSQLVHVEADENYTWVRGLNLQ